MPGRFLRDDWPREAYYPFSGGVRAITMAAPVLTPRAYRSAAV